MDGIIVKKDQLPEFIDELITKHKVFAPILKDGLTCFNEIMSSGEVSLDFQNKISSKGIFFPRCETLFKYSLSDGDVKLNDHQVIHEKAVLFGLPPCEARGFNLIDKIFSSGEYQDLSYLHRRENTIKIGKSCSHPRSTCFCTSVGGSPFGREGLDLLLHDLGDRYLLEVITEKGEKLIEKIHGYENATKTDLEKFRSLAKASEEFLKNRIEIQGVVERLDEIFDDKVWDDIYQKCVGCGVCTYLCPTCYCFDIVDEPLNPSEGKRIRIWDSCQFPLFTLQGSGENPRPTGKERMRQRIMHKFNYYPKGYNDIACVGCGRCIRECPVNLDIREVLNMITSQ